MCWDGRKCANIQFSGKLEHPVHKLKAKLSQHTTDADDTASAPSVRTDSRSMVSHPPIHELLYMICISDTSVVDHLFTKSLQHIATLPEYWKLLAKWEEPNIGGLNTGQAKLGVKKLNGIDTALDPTESPYMPLP